MGIQINGQTDIISAVDGSFTIQGATLPTAEVTNLNATGIVTATGFVGNVTGNLTGTASTATAAATAYGLSGSPTLSGITSVSTTNLTVNGNAYPSDGPLSGARNRIINGTMQVAQRGTSSTSNGYVSLDRWYVNQSGGTTTFSQETFAIGDEIEDISTYAKLVVSSSSDYTNIYQRVEDVRSLSGTVTLSFWAKGTAPNAGLKIFGTQNFGSGGSADVDLSAQGITLTTTWTRYSVNITLPSIAGKTIGSNNFLQISIGQHSDTSSAAWELNITGVQLESGSVATPFERRSYGQELALCQRYYWRTSAIADSFLPTTSDSRPRMSTSLPVEMRIAPTAAATSWSLFTTTTFMTGYYSSTSNTTLPAITCNAEL